MANGFMDDSGDMAARRAAPAWRVPAAMAMPADLEPHHTAAPVGMPADQRPLMIPVPVGALTRALKIHHSAPMCRR
ncbi:MAG TPA: hypothetical protein DDZ76_05455 [Xanthomonadales bacterium]|nr:hypothetical protein [Xanthomonadales bacterium]